MKFRLSQLLMMLAGVMLLGIGTIFWVFNSIPETLVMESQSIDAPVDETPVLYTPVEKLIQPQMADSADGATGADGDTASSSDASVMKININAATSEELQELPRVGEKTAMAIIEYRKAHGPFKTLNDLGEIRGIGEKSIARFRDLAFCGPASADAAEMPSDSASTPLTAGVEDAVEQRSGAEGSQTKKEESAAVPVDSNPTCDGSRININTATEEELQTLPRVGPAMSAKIVKYRDENGRFASIDDLKKVKGIGAKTFERLQPMICAE